VEVAGTAAGGGQASGALPFTGLPILFALVAGLSLAATGGSLLLKSRGKKK
jgi:hypothetical protein